MGNLGRYDKKLRKQLQLSTDRERKAQRENQPTSLRNPWHENLVNSRSSYLNVLYLSSTLNSLSPIVFSDFYDFLSFCDVSAEVAHSCMIDLIRRYHKKKRMKQTTSVQIANLHF